MLLIHSVRIPVPLCYAYRFPLLYVLRQMLFLADAAAFLLASTSQMFTLGARELVPGHRPHKILLSSDTSYSKVPFSARGQGRDLVAKNGHCARILVLILGKCESYSGIENINSLSIKCLFS